MTDTADLLTMAERRVAQAAADMARHGAAAAEASRRGDRVAFAAAPFRLPALRARLHEARAELDLARQFRQRP